MGFEGWVGVARGVVGEVAGGVVVGVEVEFSSERRRKDERERGGRRRRVVRVSIVGEEMSELGIDP